MNSLPRFAPRNPARRRARRLAPAMEPLEVRQVLSAWVAQGPGPDIHANNIENVPPNDPVSGAVQALVASPRNPDLLYLGSVNGGVWKTTDATDPAPRWTPLTDSKLPGLSIGSLGVSPLDPNVLFAGTGITSSLEGAGSPGYGIARSKNGGATWQVEGGATLANQTVFRVVPTRMVHPTGQVILAATAGANGGIYRSVNGGLSYTRISGRPMSDLPSAGVSDLVADPYDPRIFYAAIPASGNPGAAVGIYRSADYGRCWDRVAGVGLAGLGATQRILLAVHHDRTSDVQYAMLIGTTSKGKGRLEGVFRSTNGGGNWLALGTPATELFPGGQGDTTHGSLAADPRDPNVVFIAGDIQDDPPPGGTNPTGADSYVANIYRGIFDPARERATWENAVANGANKSAPHGDSRLMAFDANGNILEADDGGLYRLVHPDQPAERSWVSVVGNLQVTEAHSAAYDDLARVFLSGNQDVDATMQSESGSATWFSVQPGDGGNVAVDDSQQMATGISIRYTSSQQLGTFERSYWNAANVNVTYHGHKKDLIKLQIVAGNGRGKTLLQYEVKPAEGAAKPESNVQFYAPFVLNAVDPSRMLIGSRSLYESRDRGDHLVNLLPKDRTIGDGKGNTPLAYGGRLDGKADPGVLYAGSGASILHRARDGAPITTLKAYPGGEVRALAIDPQDYRHVFAVDVEDRVWASYDEGADWTELAADRRTGLAQLNSITVVDPDGTPANTAVVVAGLPGVAALRDPGAAGSTWSRLGTGLPNVLSYDVRYDARANLLSLGTVGRGVWSLPKPFAAV